MKGKVTCPECGHVQEMGIPEKKCVPFYECDSCENTIIAKEKCCVFCEYGDRKCPVGH